MKYVLLVCLSCLLSSCATLLVGVIGGTVCAAGGDCTELPRMMETAAQVDVAAMESSAAVAAAHVDAQAPRSTTVTATMTANAYVDGLPSQDGWAAFERGCTLEDPVCREVRARRVAAAMLQCPFDSVGLMRTQLAAAVRKAMADPEVLGRVRTLGGEVFSGDELAAVKFLHQQQALWTRVVRERGITVG